MPLPGFSSASVPLPNGKLAIPSLPSDIYLTMQVPRLPTLQARPNKALRRRVLLQVSAASNATTALVSPSSALALAVACPFGTYKPNAGEGRCSVCPEGASTVARGSPALSACMCKFGYYLVAKTRGPCLPCPVDTFSNVSVSVVPQSSSSSSKPPPGCTPCPANTSTLGAVGATMCACALGYVRLRGMCALCPEGFYCPPCTDADDQCTPSDQRACFAGASAPAGSHGVSNCTCMGEGLVIASRPKDPTQLYCRRLPLGAVLVQGQVRCLPGWTLSASAAMGGDTACTLCPPGTYARLAPASSTMVALTVNNAPLCVPCPAHTFNPTWSAIGGCTPCPPQFVAPEGSVALGNCSCPPSMVPVPGGCSGCLPNQYASASSSANGGACAVCPSNSLAQAGAASVNDCLCMPGFERNTNATLFCEPCKRGFYSTHASLTPCAACPRGSTTASTGATRLAACGETPDLCRPGYTWRLGVGCFQSRR